MELNRTFLSLGSNLGDRISFLESALTSLKVHGVIVLVSSVYETEPWGFDAENNFYNICIEYHTTLSPNDLLVAIHDIEASLQRQRSGVGYASRTIDIDIILFEDQILDSDSLVIPHRHYSTREFVMAPLAEIAANQVDPRNNKTIIEIYEKLPVKCAVLRDEIRLNY